jgi:dTDP-4-dehydrorhamnose reductase
MEQKIKILVLGITGMLGNAVFRFLSEVVDYKVAGTVRSSDAQNFYSQNLMGQVFSGVNVENHDDLIAIFDAFQPDIVINCIGLVKQLEAADNPLMAIPINSLLPHRLAKLSELVGARLVHFSTDCVFSGAKGMYKEFDESDARDLYGLSKYLGEVSYSNSITLRTSIIGHELRGARSLVNWFLAQEGYVRGYRRAIFSGLPTVEVARVLRDFVIPNAQLTGLYHLSADPIDKYTLLQLIAKIYKKSIDVIPEDILIIDRSLNSNRFRLATGFSPQSWEQLIGEMYKFK